MSLGVGFDVFSVAMNTSTGNQTLTGDCKGKTPKAAWIEVTYATTLGTLTTHWGLSQGLTDGTTTLCASTASLNGGVASVHFTQRCSSTSKIIEIIDPTLDPAVNPAFLAEASFVSFGVDSITISIDDAPPSAYLMKVILFYGNDLQITAGSIAMTGTNGGTTPISGLAFAPNVLLAFGGFSGFAEAVGTVQARHSYGFAVKDSGGNILQAGVNNFDRNKPNLSQQMGGAIRDDSILQRLTVAANGTLTDEARYAVTLWNADGATITTTSTGAFGMGMAYLAMKTGGCRAWCGMPTFDVTSSGNHSVTDPGFKPQFLAAIGSGVTTKNSNQSGTQAGHSLHGHHTNGTSKVVAVSGEDNAAPTEAVCLTDSKVLAIPDNAGGLLYDATFVSFDTTGFTLNVGDTDGSGKAIAFLVIEESAISSSDTEEISDQTAINVGLALSDTEQITDSMVAALGLTLSDVEEISETLVRVLAMIVSESEQIQDQLALDVILALSESEEIQDTPVVFLNAYLALSGDSEEIADEFRSSLDSSAHVTLSTDDAEEIAEAAVLLYAMVLSDLEEIMESAATPATGTIIVSDTERTTDEDLVFLGRILLVNDSEEITDRFGTTGARMHGTARGASFQGGAVAGWTYQAGCERGETFDG